MSTNGTKTMKGRISNKHGTEEYWILSVYTGLDKLTLRENPFIPLAGELIIYDPDSVCKHYRFKYGNGRQNVFELPFVVEDALLQTQLGLDTEQKTIVGAINELYNAGKEYQENVGNQFEEQAESIDGINEKLKNHDSNFQKIDDALGEHSKETEEIGKKVETIEKEIEEINKELPDFQKKTDTDLETEQKTVVGAINEVNKRIFSGSYSDLTDVPEEFKPSRHYHDEDYISLSARGANNGVASLDEHGRVPTTQLPSYVDDVIEGTYNSEDKTFVINNVVIVPEDGKIYVDIDTNITYRWSGTTYVPIGSDLALGETSLTAFPGDKGKAAYDHSQITKGNPHGIDKTIIGLENVENKSSATIRGELTKENVTTALGYTPPTTDTVYEHPETHPVSIITGLHKVATSGSYSDLKDIPETFKPSEHIHVQYQTTEDNTLKTTDKTVVGAINELNSALDGKVSVFNIDTSPTMTMLDVITTIQDAGGDITNWNIINFSGYQSATIGMQMAHYGGNVYNICGIDLSRMTVTLNTNDYSLISISDFIDGFSSFQSPSDDELETTDKTIVGAINEINAKIADLPTEFAPAEHTHSVDDIADFQDAIDNLDLPDSIYVGSEEPDGNYDIWIDPNGNKTDIVVPTVSVEKIAGGHRVSIADAYDVDTFDVMDGINGKDGANGTNGKDGTSVTITNVTQSSTDGGDNVVTFSDGKTVTVKNGSKGSSGTSVTVSNVNTSTADGGSNVVTFSDGTTLTVKNGSKGSAGTNGTNGINGKDGASVTVSSVSESTASGGNNVVTFSDGKTLTVKNGTNGTNGKDGKDYVLTDADKSDIASNAKELIDLTKYVKSVNGKTPDNNGNVTVSVNAEPPEFVDSVDEMINPDKQYVNTQTGTIWTCKSETFKKEDGGLLKKANMPFEGVYTDQARFSSSTTEDTLTTGVSQKGYHVTPIIDLAKIYQLTESDRAGNTFKLHLEGSLYAFVYNGSTYEAYIQTRSYGESKNIVTSRTYTTDSQNGNGIITAFNNISLAVNSETSATITFNGMPSYGSAQIPIYYLRFCGKHGTSAFDESSQSNIYVTYDKMVTESHWVDTGVSYGGGGVDAETLAKIAALNNEGENVTSVSLLPKPVYNYLKSPSYTDGDYSYTQIEKVTYPARADIPVPYTIKWNYNEDAMRTTVAIDTKSIGTGNAHSMLVYDVTGLNKYPIYNLLPNRTYYYKVSHVMSDGGVIEAKSGSFTTKSEYGVRLIYIDGTQNVRDLGGRDTGDGKKVKYGLLYRGGALSDSSYPELIVTGKGRRAFGDLKVQAELNLGATDTETSIASNCVYKKIGYSNYALAITTASQRENFKTALEWIVECLTAGKPVYFHCQGGCDRTGTMAFLLLGLLGVSENDLSRDYELSSFSSIGYGRWRNSTTYNYSGMVSAIKDYGSNINNAFYAFATNSIDAAQPGCGIAPSVVENFRSLMLE